VTPVLACSLRAGVCACAFVSVSLSAHAETMVTSYYHAKAPHSAAHRTLPIGTRLIITNPRNGRSAHVTISTRGPFVRGRSLDVSHTVAKQLGFGKSGVLPLERAFLEGSALAPGSLSASY
jgi:rare lipoprotein A